MENHKPLTPSAVLRRAKDLIKNGESSVRHAILTAAGHHNRTVIRTALALWDAGLSASLADPRDGQGLKGWVYWEAWDRAIALAEAKEKNGV